MDYANLSNDEDDTGQFGPFDDLVTLRDPILVAGFTGWNDAGEAASSVIRHLVDEWDAQPIAMIEGVDYYDHQVYRPYIGEDEKGERGIIWPTTRVFACSPPGSSRDVVLVQGLEPNMHWRDFCNDLVQLHHALNVQMSVLLGSMLSDIPHTRPIPITGHSTNSELLSRFNVEPSTYEGPTGIVGVLQEVYSETDIKSISFWAQVPHYVSQSPCPKATLSLLHRLEDVLNVRMPLGEMAEEVAEWESAIADILENDSEMAEFVHNLEEREGEPQPHQPSGEEIARMFEKYLRRPGGPIT